MKRLEQRVAKLEARRKQPDQSKPSWEELHAAEQRRLARTKAKLTGGHPEGDTPEQAQRDEDVIRRWNRSEGIGEEELAGVAAQTREKLQSVGSRAA